MPKLSGTFSLLLITMVLSACTPDETTPDTGAKTQGNDVEWRLHGNDPGEQRFSPLDQINRDNVGELGLAWSFDIATKRGVEATPLMVDGVLYVSGSWSVVYALNATTGELIWSYDPKVKRSWLARACCDAVNRGVAFHDGKIFVGVFDGRLVALNAETGAVEWEVLTTDQSKSYTITGAPRVVNGKVIIGNGGAEMGVRGYVSAYDSATGAMAWRFYTIPGDPDKGFESPQMEMAAKTWTGEWWKWGGGGTVWDSMAFDPELDLLYVGVGNGSPWNQTMRSPGGGDNLFLTSIVALRPDTGEYVWHYQTVPGETWDYTATQHIMLADLEIGGQQRKVLMQAPKNGFFYVLDRSTGELISAKPYTTTTWASGIDMETGRPIETENARLFDGANVSLPSNAGGHNWQPMSYNPNTGLVYIPTLQFPATFKQPTEAKDMEPNQGYWNTGFDRMSHAPPKVAGVGAILDSLFTGQLVAWDPIKQEARWTGDLGRPEVGGMLATAGGLLFTSGHDGHLTALDATTGEQLWSHQTQTAATAPPVSYSIDGEQYIAAAVGFGGGAVAEGGAVFHDWGADNIPRVLVYKLGGSHKLPAQPEDTLQMPKPPSVTGDVSEVARGQVVYQRHCSYCHGDGLRTGGITPDLRWSGPGVHQLWQKIVMDGLFENAGMVSFRDYISAEEAEAIRQYVLSEANRVYALKNKVVDGEK